MEVELENKYIVLEIPKHSVEVLIKAKVFHQGGLTTVRRTMDLDEVQAAFREAEDGYIPSDAMFQITDAGRAYLDSLKE